MGKQLFDQGFQHKNRRARLGFGFHHIKEIIRNIRESRYDCFCILQVRLNSQRNAKLMADIRKFEKKFIPVSDEIQQMTSSTGQTGTRLVYWQFKKG